MRKFLIILIMLCLPVVFAGCGSGGGGGSSAAAPSDEAQIQETISAASQALKDNDRAAFEDKMATTKKESMGQTTFEQLTQEERAILSDALDSVQKKEIIGNKAIYKTSFEINGERYGAQVILYKEVNGEWKIYNL